MSEMNRIVLDGWPWNPDICPADQQFIEWLDAKDGSGKSLSPIFHMGPGLHHKVGIECTKRDIRCISVTASLQEAKEAGLYKNHFYSVLYSNMYEIDPLVLPEFKYMTLFHIGELEYLCGKIDYEALDNIIRRVKVGGLVFFYLGSPDNPMKSSNHVQASEYLEHATGNGIGLLRPVGYYKSLQIYERMP